MKKIIALLTSMTLFTQPLLAGEIVIGPASGAVFGPSEAAGSALTNISMDVKLQHSDDDAKLLEYYALKLDEQDGKLSCQYKPDQIKAAGMATSIERLAMMSYSVSYLDDPTRAKPAFSSVGVESVDMFTATEALSAAQLSANEVEMNDNVRSFIERCQKYNKNESATSQLQLFTQACMIYQTVKLLTELNADSDTIYQKTVELNTVMNQAITENSARDEKIATEKKKVAEVNKELKTAIDKLKKAKDALKKAKDDLQKANDSLKEAQATPCTKNEDETEDCSARDAAVSAATAAQAKAQEAVDTAEKDVTKAAEALLELLKTKFNYEATTILALLSGTIKGSADGQEVFFKVNDKDFTLVNPNAAVDDLLKGKNYHEHWGRFKEENPNGTQEDFQKLVTDGHIGNYFGQVIDHYEKSKDDGKKYYDLWGGEISRQNANMMNTGILHSPNQQDVTSGILDKFSTMSKEGDNILSIASALAEYQEFSGGKQMAQMQAMKTPQSRLNEAAKKIEQLNQTNKGLREMVAQNICILDMLLVQFKQTYNLMLEKKKDGVPDPFHLYIIKFSSAPYSQKLKEGYDSKVDLRKILRDYGCLASGKGNKCFAK